MTSKWIKLNDQRPEDSNRKVQFEYQGHDGKITEYNHETTGWVLCRYFALYGREQEPNTESSVTVWRYPDPDSSGD